MSLNTARMQLEPEDSLGRLAREMEQKMGLGGQQVGSFKEVKDQTKSSFGCPWAVEEKVGFRTTSNAYGNHYKRR
jgi:hypothetical protein